MQLLRKLERAESRPSGKIGREQAEELYHSRIAPVIKVSMRYSSSATPKTHFILAALSGHLCCKCILQSQPRAVFP